MTYRLLTCPETAHLELIDYVDDPLGMLVSACSRFWPPGAIECPRTCAARLDRGARCARLCAAELVEREVGDDTGVVDLGADDTYGDALAAMPLAP